MKKTKKTKTSMLCLELNSFCDIICVTVINISILGTSFFCNADMKCFLIYILFASVLFEVDVYI